MREFFHFTLWFGIEIAYFKIVFVKAHKEALEDEHIMHTGLQLKSKVPLVR